MKWTNLQSWTTVETSAPDSIHLSLEQRARLEKEAQDLLRLFGNNPIDANPISLPGNLLYACGPTTGLWVSANRLKVIGTVWVGRVIFTLAVHDPDADD